MSTAPPGPPRPAAPPGSGTPARPADSAARATDRAPLPQRVPTLTEVVQPPPLAPRPLAPPPSVAAVSDEELAQRLMAAVQRQVDLLLEVRLREAMSPLLARLTDALVREMRAELTAAMREVVTQAVAQEAARLRRGR